MCPHCLLALVGASIVTVKAAPYALPLLKSKFSRQDAKRKNFDTLYGKKDDHAS